MSQRVRVLWIVALAVVPLAALSALLIIRDFEERREAVAAERVGLVQAAAFAVRLFVDNHVASAQAIALHPALEQARATPELSAFFGRVARQKPEWAGIGFVGPDGHSILASRGGAKVFIGDRPYFRQVMATGAPVVSDAVIGRLSGKATIVVAAPVALASGGRGLLAAPLPIDAFSAELLARLGQGARRVVLLDGEARALIHNLPGRVQALEAMRDAPGVSEALHGRAGSALAGFRGEHSLVAYAPVAPYGWAVLLAEPEAQAFAQARAELRQGLGALAAIVLAVAGLGWFLGGRVAMLYDSVERSVRTRDEFLAAASHDLRNPLAAMRGAADLMRLSLERTGTVMPERLAGCVTHIDAAARRMAQLIDGLLDVASLQMGAPLELALAGVDLAALVRDAVQEARLASPRHRILLEAPEALPIHGDAPRLQRAIANLLSNAVKYSAAGAMVRVALSADHDGAAVLSVADTGIGIPPSELKRIFQRFQRGSNVIGRIAGTGLGLAAARQVVEQHGGSITLSSRLGEGSVFTVRLPAAAGRPDNSAERRAA